MPATEETRARLRLLSGWAAVSTPLLLTAFGLAFLPARCARHRPDRGHVDADRARHRSGSPRHLAGYLLAVLLLVVALVATGAFVVFVLTWGWRYVITGTFWTLATILLIANVQELGRD